MTTLQRNIFVLLIVILLGATMKYPYWYNFQNLRDISLNLISKVYPLEEKYLFESQGYKQHSTSLRSEMKKSSATIIFIGDSLIYQLPTKVFFPGERIFNAGIPGDTTLGVLRRYDSISNLNIKCLFILVGHNDLKYRDIDEIISNYSRLLNQRLKFPVFVISIPPTSRKRIFLNKKIRTINEKLAELCSQHSVEFVDIYSVFANESGGIKEELTTDGTHLSKLGYELLAKHIVPRYTEHE